MRGVVYGKVRHRVRITGVHGMIYMHIYLRTE